MRSVGWVEIAAESGIGRHLQVSVRRKEIPQTAVGGGGPWFIFFFPAGPESRKLNRFAAVSRMKNPGMGRGERAKGDRQIEECRDLG